MELKDREKYEGWKAKQADSDDPTGAAYGMACFTYAEQWADLMEAGMAEGKKIEDIAKDTSHEADTDGITGFMYGMAVSILSRCWIHGEELRQWHNLKTAIGDEGKKANESGGVLNPALLTIGGKKSD